MSRQPGLLINEWGVPEPTPAQEEFIEDVAHYAGCPDTTCGELNICGPCGMPVCVDHTTNTVQCTEIGTHHEACTDDCPSCVDDRAREYAQGGW